MVTLRMVTISSTVLEFRNISSALTVCFGAIALSLRSIYASYIKRPLLNSSPNKPPVNLLTVPVVSMLPDLSQFWRIIIQNHIRHGARLFFLITLISLLLAFAVLFTTSISNRTVRSSPTRNPRYLPTDTNVPVLASLHVR